MMTMEIENEIILKVSTTSTYLTLSIANGNIGIQNNIEVLMSKLNFILSQCLVSEVLSVNGQRQIITKALIVKAYIIIKAYIARIP
jgi:hypothetical protein